MKPRKLICFSGVIFTLLILIGESYYMCERTYQMAIFVTPKSEDDPEWPNKRKWFDASKWLKTPQYIKINEFYLINKKFIPLGKSDRFGITRRLQEAIRDSSNAIPELSEINNMEENGFLLLMESTYSYEYLRSEFDSDTLEPTEDYFLLFFNYKGVDYELELLRTIYKGMFVFMPFGSSIHKAGYWHPISPKGYSYRDYLAGKPIR